MTLSRCNALHNLLLEINDASGRSGQQIYAHICDADVMAGPASQDGALIRQCSCVEVNGTFCNDIQHAVLLAADLANLSCASHRVKVDCSRIASCHTHLSSHKQTLATSFCSQHRHLNMLSGKTASLQGKTWQCMLHIVQPTSMPLNCRRNCYQLS